MNASGRDRLLSVAAIAGALFGAVTVAAGGRVLFGGDAPRAAAGATVSFVLWFNFLAGFATLPRRLACGSGNAGQWCCQR